MKSGNDSMLGKEIFLLRSASRKGAIEFIKKHNLERLKHAGMLKGFVRKNNGSWDHEKWIVLCEDISLNEYEPIDFDKIGILLEEEKSRFFNSRAR